MTPSKAKLVEHEFKGQYHYAVGKRKTSVALVRLYRGAGKFVVNGVEAKKYFSVGWDAFTAPFKVAELAQKEYDLSIEVSGGGIHSQAEACRHGVTQALELEDATRRKALKAAGFLTRDARIKERKKPGLKRARRSPQWAKR